MIKNLLIYGSCVSRDIFNLEHSRVFKLTDYFARSSMASLSSSPYANDAALDRIPSAFRRRMVGYDFSKELILQPERLSSADIILIDLIDERFDLVALPTGQVITHSSELTESGLLADSDIQGFRLIQQGTEERRALWLEGMQKFIELLKQHNKLDSVLVNKVYWASQFETPSDSNFPVTLTAVNNANQELEWMYAALHSQLEDNQFLTFPPELLTADESHRWGASPFHYCEGYYKEALSQLTSTQKSIGGDNPAINDASGKAPLVSDGAKITVAAYRTESEIFAHCSLVMDGKIYENGNFAFYLLIDGVRHDVRWYEPSPRARFPIPDTPGELVVVAFYKDPQDQQTSSKRSVSCLTR